MEFATVPQFMDAGEVGRGVGLEDLERVNGELFLAGVRAARASHDPCVDFEGFVAALWVDLAGSFGWQDEARGRSARPGEIA